jgi:eukaryotic-like serine/threonine-protein kinase
VPSDSLVLTGRYRLESVLGDGGMGRVWRGHDETLGRAVAVKEVLFPPDVSDRDRDALAERTMREAQLTAQLNHPAVVTTYDAVVHEGRPFIVMELVPSVSLAERVAEQGSLPPETVRRIGLVLVDALRTAHRQGIVHRDVKPSNVLIANDDRVLLSDFGIATRESDPVLTSTGVLVGSPAYMSPERLRGERATPAADVWSLGATLYAALEGRPPFQAGTTMGTITAIMTDEVAPPSVGGDLADLVAGMLRKDPRDRLTLDEVRDALTPPRRPEETQELSQPAVPPAEAPENADPHPTREPDPAEHEQPVWVPRRDQHEARDDEPAWLTGAAPAAPARRRRMPVALLTAVALLLVVGVVGAAMWLSEPGGEDGQPQAQPTADDAPNDRGGSPAAQSSGAEQSVSPSPTQEPSPTPTSASVPEGYRMHQDQLGFRLAVPQGWERQLDGATRVDFVSPDGSSFVRIDQREQALPDAAQAWRDQEAAVAESLPGYERIRIDEVPHPRWNVADWEFTWEGDNGTVHVLNRGIATDTRGFAVYVSTPDSQWPTEGQRLFGVASETFTPTG